MVSDAGGDAAAVADEGCQWGVLTERGEVPGA